MDNATLPKHRWGVPEASYPGTLKKRPSITKRHLFLACLILGVVIGGVYLFTAEYGGAGYSATIEQVVPVTFNHVWVTVEVKNLGSSSGTPTCRIAVNSPDRSVTGTWTQRVKNPIPGGWETTFKVTIPVTTNGANSVTWGASNVSCQ